MLSEGEDTQEKQSGRKRNDNRGMGGGKFRRKAKNQERGGSLARIILRILLAKI